MGSKMCHSLLCGNYVCTCHGSDAAMSFVQINFILMNIRSLFADVFVSNLEFEGHKEQRHAMLKAPGEAVERSETKTAETI